MKKENNVKQYCGENVIKFSLYLGFNLRFQNKLIWLKRALK